MKKICTITIIALILSILIDYFTADSPNTQKFINDFNNNELSLGAILFNIYIEIALIIMIIKSHLKIESIQRNNDYLHDRLLKNQNKIDEITKEITKLKEKTEKN